MTCQLQPFAAWVEKDARDCGARGQADNAAADGNSGEEFLKDDGCAEGVSAGRGPPIRPLAVRVTKDSEAGSKQALAAAAALDWQPPMSEKHREGSATSDEDHPRLVPRRGAGPGLRSGGQEIDEYLMRLLCAGSANASEAAFFRNEVPSAVEAKRGRGASLQQQDGVASATVGFPAGWDTGRPWFLTGQTVRGAAHLVKPPPPPFPAQPVQGSRLGPLPPTGLFAQRQSRPMTSAAKAAAATAPPDPAEACPRKRVAGLCQPGAALTPTGSIQGISSGATAVSSKADDMAQPSSQPSAVGNQDSAKVEDVTVKLMKASADGLASGLSSAGLGSTAVDFESAAAAAAETVRAGTSGGAGSGSAAATDSGVCLDRSYLGTSGGSGGANSKATRESGADAVASRPVQSSEQCSDTAAAAPLAMMAAAPAAVVTSDAAPLCASPCAELVRRRLGDAAYARLRDDVLSQHALHREQVAELHRVAARQVQLQLQLQAQQRAAAAVANSAYPFGFGGFPVMPPPPCAPAPLPASNAAATEVGKPAGSAAAPVSEAGGGMSWFAAAMAQAHASGLSAYGAGGFDPMSAWYAYHLGQQALAKGAPPSAAAFSNRLAGMGEGGNPWLAQAGLMNYMAGGMGPPAQAYGNVYDGNVPDASPQRAASQESARESGPAPSGGSASFGGDRTLPAKKRGRISNAAVTSRRGSTEPDSAPKRHCAALQA